MAGLAGANLIYGMGMLDMGMVFSFRQLLIDHEIARMIRRTVGGIEVNPELLALEVIEKVGIGGNYLTRKHTIKHMKTEQIASELMDRNTRDNWIKGGCRDLAETAAEKARKILAEHRPLPLAAGLEEEFSKLMAAETKALKG